jgi:3-(methylthio)propanoyl-CoA dehydrogenase
MSYAAPVRDMLFTLEEVVAMSSLKSTGAFPDLSGDVVHAVLEEAARWTGDVLSPLNKVGDQEGASLENGVVRTASGFKEAYQQFVEGGWQGLPFAEEYGGAGLPRTLAAAVGEMVDAANMAFGLCPMLTLGAVEALLAHGTPEQQKKYLPKLVTGEWTGSMNLTEPRAGSDVGLLKSKAWKAEDGTYRVQGQKIWITWGEHDCTQNIIHLVLARLPDAPEGTRGVSLFLVPKFLVNEDGSLGRRNDLKCIGLEHKMGIHASPTCVMSYGDEEGAIGELIGPENGGMRAMFTMMNSARINVGRQGVALAEAAFQKAGAFAADRRQGKVPSGEAPGRIIEHPDVRRMLLSSKARIAAGRAIVYSATLAADLSEHAEDEEERAAAARRENILTPIAKGWCTEMGIEVASLGVQVHGGMGFVEEAGAAQHYRDVRIAAIYEGTNGIQALDLVGRKLKGDQGVAFEELCEDIRQTIEDMELSSNPALHPLADILDDALEAVEDLADWMLDEDTDANDVATGATRYARALGDVVAGWYLCVGAVAAQRRIKEGEGAPDYNEARIALARFFAEDVLTGVPGAAASVTLGYEQVMAIPEELLLA